MTEDRPDPSVPGPFELRSERLGALPIVDLFLRRAGVERVLSRWLAAGDRRVALPAATAIGVLVRNLCLAREPLYGLAEWAKRYEVNETVHESFRQEKRGRPGAETRYRKITKTTFTLTFHVDEHNVAYDAATDGCFPLVANDRQLTDPELLAAYRYQPNLEQRHHQLKTVLQAAPVELKSPSRIEGLACCEFIALLTQCLIERELRAAMARENISALALYHEDRPSKAPTAARVFDLFADTTRHHLISHDGDIVQVFEPDLSDLQRHVLDLLGVPHDAYQSTTTDP